jgi:hypothetical protein
MAWLSRSSRSAAIAFALALLVTSVARATSPADASAAQTLFDEARRLMAAGRHAEACPKFVESQRLDPGGGTLLNIAVCHAAEGKVATAIADYRRALEQALRDKRRDRERVARDAIAALEKNLPHLTIMVPADARPEGLEVVLDDLPVLPSDWGRPLPVDPGPHTVTVSAPKHIASTQTLKIGLREDLSVSVDRPQREGGEPKEPTPNIPMVVVETPAPSSAAQANAEVMQLRSNPVYVGAAVTTGISATVMAVTGVLALSSRGTAKIACNIQTGFCIDESSQDTLRQSNVYAWISTGALAVAAVSTVVLILAPARVRVSLGPTNAGAELLVRGQF